MHTEQKDFCKMVKRRFRLRFIMRPTVYDVGSLDVNGTNRYLFFMPKYTGIDIVQGKNVDMVGRAMDVLPGLPKAEIVISTEMLEHDATWRESLIAMYSALGEGGLLIITAAGEGRHEHGTHAHSPQDSPGTNDYYQNISHEMFASVLNPQLFSEYFMRHDYEWNDFQFYGVKRSSRRFRDRSQLKQEIYPSAYERRNY